MTRSLDGATPEGGSPPAPTLRLVVRTPSGVVVDRPVVAVNAEDASGRFGLRPGVEPLVSALVPTMLEYRDPSGESHLVAVHQGALVATRDEVRVAVRRAVPCSSLEAVRAEVRAAARGEALRVREVRHTFRGLFRRLYGALIEEERRR